MTKIIKIATRESPLALWQAEHVKDLIVKHYPEVTVELVGIKTIADKFLETRLQKIGGKGLFVKELEEALLSKACDIAVHSMKDMPYQLPDGLGIIALLPRHDPSDCLVGAHGISVDNLKEGAVVGTSSLRRECQIKALRPDLVIEPIRGNVNTRLRKLEEGQFDALIMATAGLERLGMEDKINYRFNETEMLPAVGQGIIGIESRLEDDELNKLLAKLNDPISEVCISAERKLNECLGGNCHLPVAAYATCDSLSSPLTLKGSVGSVESNELINHMAVGTVENPEQLGEVVAKALLDKGAGAFIEEARARE